jgi:hypothetical protein
MDSLVSEFRRGRREGWFWPYMLGLLIGTVIAGVVLTLVVPGVI